VNASDRLYLQAAVDLAERGRFTCAPNPTVGCIIVRNGTIIGRGFHAETGEGHAEVNAIANAGGDVAGATVFVSLEPCSFVSRTPACAQTLIDAGVARVVVAAEDPHPRVSGAGINILRNAGIEVALILVPEALSQISGYTSRVTQSLPLVRVKTASSIDGATALESGESQWITGAEARADVQYWRARSDAVITGVGTVLADDPQMNVRDFDLAPYRQPLRVVLDGALQTPANAQILAAPGGALLVHDPETLVPDEIAGLENVELLAPEGGSRDLAAVLAALAELGCNEVMVEAGAGVCGAFATAELWDEWLCYIAPKWLGQASRGVANFEVAALQSAPQGEVMEVRRIGDDIRVRLARVPA